MEWRMFASRSAVACVSGCRYNWPERPWLFLAALGGGDDARRRTPSDAPAISESTESSVPSVRASGRSAADPQPFILDSECSHSLFLLLSLFLFSSDYSLRHIRHFTPSKYNWCICVDSHLKCEVGWSNTLLSTCWIRPYVMTRAQWCPLMSLMTFKYNTQKQKNKKLDIRSFLK